MKITIFNDALKSMISDAGQETGFSRLADDVANGIKQGQRFYVPFGGGPIAERKFSEFLDSIRLPFPLTVVGSEAINEEEPSDRQEWVLVCKQFDGRLGFSFIGCLLDKRVQGGWFPIPPGSVTFNEHGKMGVGIYDTEPGRLMLKANPDLKPSKIFGGIISSVVALSVMLTLKNVSSENISVRPAVNSKRRERGDLPLYSYKILNVGGERWTSNGADYGDGHGYRSHLRRGHIRRISDDRAVWVNATYVHGRTPGFVDKDYNVGAVA